MIRTRSIVSALVLVLLASPSFAGEHCTASAQQCLDKMAAHLQSSGWAGMEGEWSEEHGTLTVTSIAAKSPAAQAGVQVGDVLFGINGIRFGKMTDAQRAEMKAAKVAGNTVTYMAKRGSEKLAIAIELATMPEEVVAASVGRHMLEHAQVASVQ